MAVRIFFGSDVGNTCIWEVARVHFFMVIQVSIIPGVAEEYYEKNVAELRIVPLCLWVLVGR